MNHRPSSLVLLLLLGLSFANCKNSSADSTAEEVTPSSNPPATSSPSAEEAQPTASDTSSLMEDIRQEFSLIQTLVTEGQLRLDSMNYECPDEPRGGFLSRYYQGEELRLLKHEYYLGDHNWIASHWYFKEQSCFFAFREEGSWRFDGPGVEEGTPATRDDFKEYRYYFGPAEEPLRILEKAYSISSRDASSLDPATVPNVGIADLSPAAFVLEEGRGLVKSVEAEQGLSTVCEF